jgi:hypothetical protein
MADFMAPRRAAFRKLHESHCFVVPNPWDYTPKLFGELVRPELLESENRISSGSVFALRLRGGR